MTLLRSDLIRRIARKNPTLGEGVVSQILNVFFQSILQHIHVDSRVELRGFGSFASRSYVLKSANVALGKMQYKRMYFRPSEKLIKAVNQTTHPKNGSHS
ncbi:HU family DNA-binding protein [Anaplasma phagocytophilum]|uniref:HU family DNA-binding protein n=1 Tax=Anaplasma phagocytophilum TaxID=948 RepID=UPI0032C42510